MRDSWMGSGINSTVKSFDVTCPNCDTEWVDDFQVDDWGNVEEEIKCYQCSEPFTFTHYKGKYE
jgi:hypothetical protein